MKKGWRHKKKRDRRMKKHGETDGPGRAARNARRSWAHKSARAGWKSAYRSIGYSKK